MSSEPANAHPLSRGRFPFGLVLGLGGLLFALELLTSFQPDYGYFLDELYYIACAKRLDWGYVDHPPLAPAILALNRALLGDSVLAIRLLPALCGTVTVGLSGWVVWIFGGRRLAQLLSAACVITAPITFGIFGFFSMNCFEILLWTLALCVFIKLCLSRDDRLWWLIGTIVGVALLGKHTSVLLAVAIALAVPLSPLRVHLRGRNLWLGVAMAIVLVLPNLYWQLQNDWASLVFYANSNLEANVSVSMLDVLAFQIAAFNPAAAPVWAAGLFLLLFGRHGRGVRPVGFAIAALFVALLLAGTSRPDRIMGIYPVLFGAGAVQLEAVACATGWRWPLVGLLAAVIALGLVVAPMIVPILSPADTVEYMDAFEQSGDEIQREVGEALLMLPLAHRRGSEELVREVTRVYEALEVGDRERTIILATGYAPAGAIELLAGDALPPVYSPHNNYYLWGPPTQTPDLVITVGFEPEQLAKLFASVEVVARARCQYCMGWRQNTPIALAREPRQPLEQAWESLGHFGYSLRKVHLLELAGQL